MFSGMLEGRQTIDSYEENQEKNNNDVDMSVSWKKNFFFFRD